MMIRVAVNVCELIRRHNGVALDIIGDVVLAVGRPIIEVDRVPVPHNRKDAKLIVAFNFTEERVHPLRVARIGENGRLTCSFEHELSGHCQETFLVAHWSQRMRTMPSRITEPFRSTTRAWRSTLLTVVDKIT